MLQLSLCRRPGVAWAACDSPAPCPSRLGSPSSGHLASVACCSNCSREAVRREARAHFLTAAYKIEIARVSRQAFMEAMAEFQVAGMLVRADPEVLDLYLASSVRFLELGLADEAGDEFARCNQVCLRLFKLITLQVWHPHTAWLAGLHPRVRGSKREAREMSG